MRRCLGLMQMPSLTSCVVLLLCALSTVRGMAQDAAPGGLQSLGPGVVTVWVSARQESLKLRTVQDMLAKEAPGLQPAFRTFPSNNFGRALAAARSSGTLPDVVFSDNPILIWQMILQQSVVEMLGQPRFTPSLGWWFQVQGSPHPQAARLFFNWLEWSRGWTAPATSGLTGTDKTEIASIAGKAVSAMATGASRDFPLDRDASVHFDPTFGTYCGDTYSVANPTLEFLSGNGTVAYASLSSQASADKSSTATIECAGTIHSFVVLRRRQDGWKVLWIEPRIGVLEAEGYASSFDRLGLLPGGGAAPAAPSLIAPRDGENEPLHPRGDFSWSQSAVRPVTYVVESAAGVMNDGKLEYGPSVISFVSPGDFGDVVQMPRPFGVAEEPYRWRVWAIGKDGQIALSEWRAVVFTG